MRARRGAPQVPRTRRRGLTLVEVLIAIVAPRFVDVGARSKEAGRQRNLKLLQEAVVRFEADCRLYPANLKDLAALSAPAQGLDSSGAARAIEASDWHGPYVHKVPADPVSGGSYGISKTPPTVGKVLLPSEVPAEMVGP
jgi:hypothetical protein